MGREKKYLLTAVRFLPLILCLILMVIFLLSGTEITAESLKKFAPNMPLLAALFLVALYAFKSMTVVFPIIVLNVLGGFLFSPGWAIIVNFIGVAVELAIPYWVGHLSGVDLVHRLEARYPKFSALFGEQSQDHFFLSFFLRVIFCLPGDLVSMYFGAISMPFGKYMLGSFLGMVPGTIAATLLGMSISDPSSPLFWFSIILTVGMSVASVIAHCLWKKFHAKKQYAAGRC